jgi:hypothetical protein
MHPSCTPEPARSAIFIMAAVAVGVGADRRRCSSRAALEVRPVTQLVSLVSAGSVVEPGSRVSVRLAGES